MTRSLTAAALLAVFVLIALARLPAAWLAPRVAAACAARCALTGVEGTWREGRARLVALDGRGAASPLLPLAWRWQPAALFGGALAWQLDAPATGALRLDMHGLHAQAMPFAVSAAAIEPLLAGRSGLARWGGTVTLRIDALACDRQGDCRGNVAGDWRGARFASAYAEPVGDYDFALTREGESSWQASVKATRGPLWLALSTQAGRVAGEAWIDEAARPKLAPLVGGLARFDAGTGRYRVDLPLVLDGSAP